MKTLIAFGLLLGSTAWALVPRVAIPPVDPRVAKMEAAKLTRQLGAVRGRILSLQQNLIDSLRSDKQTKASVKKIQTLMGLQRQERELGKKRMAQLEVTVAELESRRADLEDRVRASRASVRRFLSAIESSTRGAAAEDAATPSPGDREWIEAPRRRVLANLAERGFRELETLKVDLSDSQDLERKIDEEKQQLANLLQDLNEQEGVLELNRQLQVDLLKRNHQSRVAQLESYRRLKSAENQVEKLIDDFSARLELEHSLEAERQTARDQARAMAQIDTKLSGRSLASAAALPAGLGFLQLKGRLPLPVLGGKVVSQFGRSFDARSQLHVFKKGIDIATGSKVAVRAISQGKVAYSGELPDLGRVMIIDHGDHFYSLCAHLGELTRRAGENVAAGDSIGATDESGTPVYFEIRSRNVAVNPLQWLVN